VCNATPIDSLKLGGIPIVVGASAVVTVGR
jgi:hypothetical protein